VDSMKMLSAKQAARYLGVSLATLRRIGAMSIPRYQASLHRVVYSEADLVAYFQSVKIEPFRLPARVPPLMPVRLTSTKSFFDVAAKPKRRASRRK
jgi:helix-turn-helix protein